MYDSTTASDIPSTAQIVAGYVDGAYAWSGRPEVPSGDWAKFPNAKKITITVNGFNLAAVVDCEAGDLTPDQAASWIQNFPGSIVYTSLSMVPAVKAAMGNLQWKLWTAHYTGIPHICDGTCLANNRMSADTFDGITIVGTQYADPVTSGGHFDLSYMTPEFLSIF